MAGAVPRWAGRELAGACQPRISATRALRLPLLAAPASIACRGSSRNILTSGSFTNSPTSAAVLSRADTSRVDSVAYAQAVLVLLEYGRGAGPGAAEFPGAISYFKKEQATEHFPALVGSDSRRSMGLAQGKAGQHR